jgi:transposase
MKCNPDKTDYADARMLAELSRVGLIPPVWLAPKPIRELRLLVRLRADLVNSARACKTRILAVLRQQRIAEPQDEGCRWTRRWLAWLGGCGLSEQGRFVVTLLLEELASISKRVKAVEAQLEQATVGDAVVERLLAIKGVGPVTAWTMRALIGRFDRFATGKQLARFCAVTPRNASSGQRVADSGLVKAGDPQLKSVLIEAAQRLRRYHPRWRALGDSMRARGLAASVIVAAVANRWVRGLLHQMKEPAVENGSGVTMAA